MIPSKLKLCLQLPNYYYVTTFWCASELCHTVNFSSVAALKILMSDTANSNLV